VLRLLVLFAHAVSLSVSLSVSVLGARQGLLSLCCPRYAGSACVG
jgi:hypothetical protein